MASTLETLRYITHALANEDPAPLALLGTLPTLSTLEREYLHTHLLSPSGLPLKPKPHPEFPELGDCVICVLHNDPFGYLHAEAFVCLNLGVRVQSHERGEGVYHLCHSIAYELWDVDRDRFIQPHLHILLEAHQRRDWCGDYVDDCDFGLEWYASQIHGFSLTYTPREWIAWWVCSRVGLEAPEVWREFAEVYAGCLDGA